MIPRLAPRRTTPIKSRHELSIGMENDDPTGASTRSQSAMFKPVAASAAALLAASGSGIPPRRAHMNDPDQETSTYTARTTPASTATARRSVLKASTTNVLEAPLSPHVTPSYDFLLDPSSALTPPVTGPRPLVVSAKRVANYVRRQNSSKRLRRRTSASSEAASSSSSNSSSTSRSVIPPHTTDGTAYCLWRDAGAPPRADESSSDDEEEETLPCHPNPQGYWEYCYGSHGDVVASHPPTSEGKSVAVAVAVSAAETITTSTWSAHRKPPSKGWYVQWICRHRCLYHLSYSHTHNNNIPSHSLSHRNRPHTIHAGLQSFYTPPTTPDDDEGEVSSHSLKTMTGPRVQFGSPQAVEFDSEGPAVHLTPLPSEVTRQRYSMMQVEPSKGEADMSVETKRNTALLAEWEDDGPVQVTSSAARRRQQRNTRRSSSIFTPSPHSTSLLDDERDVAGEMPISTVRRDTGRGDASPATMVLENLASLCVNSPSIEQPVLTPMSISLCSSSSDSSSSPSSGNQVVVASTSELAISLKDLNSHGGAVAPTVRRVPSPDAGYTTGIDTMSLQAIHSVGGALGTGPAHEGRQLSPISRMSHSATAVTVTVPPPLTPDLLRNDGLARVRCTTRMMLEKTRVVTLLDLIFPFV